MKELASADNPVALLTRAGIPLRSTTSAPGVLPWLACASFRSTGSSLDQGRQQDQQCHSHGRALVESVARTLDGAKRGVQCMRVGVDWHGPASFSCRSFNGRNAGMPDEVSRRTSALARAWVLMAVCLSKGKMLCEKAAKLEGWLPLVIAQKEESQRRPASLARKGAGQRSAALARCSPCLREVALEAGARGVQHQVHQHTGDRDIEPDWKRVACNPAM